MEKEYTCPLCGCIINHKRNIIMGTVVEDLDIMVVGNELLHKSCIKQMPLETIKKYCIASSDIIAQLMQKHRDILAESIIGVIEGIKKGG